MGQIAMELSPPLWWQEFQELTLDVCRHRWPTAKVDIYGREGQRQNGVDIFVQSDGKTVGLQCKRRRRSDANGRYSVNGALDERELDLIIIEAEAFDPPLDEFIIATSGLRDTQLQDCLLKLNPMRTKAGKFPVTLWTWEYIQGEINKQPDLLYRHYELVLKSRQDYDRELHLLCVARTAFTRPAFDTPLNREDSGADFREALIDTQNAITTGTLVDREFKDRIIDRAPIGIADLSDKWRSQLELVRDKLQELRDTYRAGVHAEKIKEMDAGIRAKPDVAAEIDRLRAEAIELLNGLLAKAGLTPVSSRLLSSSTATVGRRKGSRERRTSGLPRPTG
jgi:hypothetical protein